MRRVETAILLVLATAIMGAAFISAATSTTTGCRTKACHERVRAERAWDLCVERRGVRFCVYRNRWRRLSERAKYWTRCVTEKESRWDRRAYNRAGPYFSYFQWALSTAKAAGLKAHPYLVSWFEQAVKAWRWHLRVPRGQWPRTGERGICGG